MKKTLLTILVSAASVAAFAQGIVNFANDGTILPFPPDRLIRFATASSAGNVFGTNNAPAVGTNYQVQLYYGASTATEASLIPVTSNPARLRGSTSLSAGIWSAGGNRTFVGFDTGVTITLQVRVWDINAGSTYEAAAANPGNNGSIGKSQTFAYLIPAGTDAANQAMFNFTGFSVTGGGIIPEPGTFALAGLGAAALLVFRRKK
jgi:hypothetical protein